jgi:hypothetical protein
MRFVRALRPLWSRAVCKVSALLLCSATAGPSLTLCGWLIFDLELRRGVGRVGVVLEAVRLRQSSESGRAERPVAPAFKR